MTMNQITFKNIIFIDGDDYSRTLTLTSTSGLYVYFSFSGGLKVTHLIIITVIFTNKFVLFKI